MVGGFVDYICLLAGYDVVLIHSLIELPVRRQLSSGEKKRVKERKDSLLISLGG